jgi:hypothetical protein
MQHFRFCLRETLRGEERVRTLSAVTRYATLNACMPRRRDATPLTPSLPAVAAERSTATRSKRLSSQTQTLVERTATGDRRSGLSWVHRRGNLCAPANKDKQPSPIPIPMLFTKFPAVPQHLELKSLIDRLSTVMLATGHPEAPDLRP